VRPTSGKHARACLSGHNGARSRGRRSAPFSSSDTSCDLDNRPWREPVQPPMAKSAARPEFSAQSHWEPDSATTGEWCTTKIGSQMAPSSGPAAAAGSANSLLTWEFWSGWPDLNRRPLRPEANKRRRLPGLGVPDLGSTVHRCPLASIAGDGDSYSLGYSPLAHARTGLLARPDP